MKPYILHGGSLHTVYCVYWWEEGGGGHVCLIVYCLLTLNEDLRKTVDPIHIILRINQ